MCFGGILLDLVYAAGAVCAMAQHKRASRWRSMLDYSTPKRATYKPDGTLVLRFGNDRITVHGSNLECVRQGVTEGRAQLIQEGTDAVHIDRIEILERQEEF